MNAFKEAAKRKKTAPGGEETKKSPEKEAVRLEAVPDEVLNEALPEKVEKEKPKTGEINALLDGITGEKKPIKKSATLYLSADNLTELKKRAKKAGISSSEFLDQVMTKLFN